MQQHLFEYAIIRIVPRVEREEFINTGVVLYCKKLKYLQCRISFNETRICAIAGSSEIDLDAIRANLFSFEQICAATAASGPIGKLDAASRFRWLTAVRSTVVQAGKVHPGMAEEMDSALDHLFANYVL